MASKDIAQLWEPLPGVELFNARLYRHIFSKHFHDAYTIGLTIKGRGACQFNGENHIQAPGCLHLLNPGEVHTGQPVSEAGWALHNIYLSPTRVEQLLNQLEFNHSNLPAWPQLVVWDTSLRTTFCRLFRSLNTSAVGLEPESLLLQLLSQLLCKQAQSDLADSGQTGSLGQSESKAIRRVRAYLEANYHQTISLAELAQIANLSPFYLIRSFHRQVGLPPHAYQRQWQLLQAKRSLRSAKPLTVIALEHGFYDQSHLTRTFKRTFGVTPGSYQKSHQKGNFVQSPRP